MAAGRPVPLFWLCLEAIKNHPKEVPQVLADIPSLPDEVIPILWNLCMSRHLEANEVEVKKEDTSWSSWGGKTRTREQANIFDFDDELTLPMLQKFTQLMLTTNMFTLIEARKLYPLEYTRSFWGIPKRRLVWPKQHFIATSPKILQGITSNKIFFAHLNLSYSHVDDEGLRQLNYLSDYLVALNLRQTKISDWGLESLCRFKALKHLDISRTNTTGAFLELWRRRLTKLSTPRQKRSPSELSNDNVFKVLEEEEEELFTPVQKKKRRSRRKKQETNTNEKSKENKDKEKEKEEGKEREEEANYPRLQTLFFDETKISDLKGCPGEITSTIEDLRISALELRMDFVQQLIPLVPNLRRLSVEGGFHQFVRWEECQDALKLLTASLPHFNSLALTGCNFPVYPSSHSIKERHRAIAGFSWRRPRQQVDEETVKQRVKEGLVREIGNQKLHSERLRTDIVKKISPQAKQSVWTPSVASLSGKWLPYLPRITNLHASVRLCIDVQPAQSYYYYRHQVESKPAELYPLPDLIAIEQYAAKEVRLRDLKALIDEFSKVELPLLYTHVEGVREEAMEIGSQNRTIAKYQAQIAKLQDKLHRQPQSKGLVASYEKLVTFLEDAQARVTKAKERIAAYQIKKLDDALAEASRLESSDQTPTLKSIVLEEIPLESFELGFLAPHIRQLTIIRPLFIPGLPSGRFLQFSSLTHLAFCKIYIKQLQMKVWNLIDIMEELPSLRTLHVGPDVLASSSYNGRKPKLFAYLNSRDIQFEETCPHCYGEEFEGDAIRSLFHRKVRQVVVNADTRLMPYDMGGVWCTCKTCENMLKNQEKHYNDDKGDWELPRWKKGEKNKAMAKKKEKGKEGLAKEKNEEAADEDVMFFPQVTNCKKEFDELCLLKGRIDTTFGQAQIVWTDDRKQVKSRWFNYLNETL